MQVIWNHDNTVVFSDICKLYQRSIKLVVYSRVDQCIIYMMVRDQNRNGAEPPEYLVGRCSSTHASYQMLEIFKKNIYIPRFL